MSSDNTDRIMRDLQSTLEKRDMKVVHYDYQEQPNLVWFVTLFTITAVAITIGFILGLIAGRM